MFFKETREGIICSIKVIPNASKNDLGEILQINSGKEVINYLKVYIKSPAVEGKANKELIAFLAKKWRLKKTDIKIIKGESQRYKTVLIEGNLELLLLKLSDL